jgi:hypothetical protein
LRINNHFIKKVFGVDLRDLREIKNFPQIPQNFAEEYSDFQPRYNHCEAQSMYEAHSARSQLPAAFVPITTI